MVSMLARLALSTTILCGLVVLVTGTCSSPPTNPGTTVELEGNEFEVGTIAVYKCRIGHHVSSGNGQSTCTSSGTWTVPTMKCSPILCPEPQKPDNGKVIGTEFSYGKTVTFECNEGYHMMRSDGEELLPGEDPERECTADSNWNGYTPVCKPVTCQDVRNVISNGHVEMPLSLNFMALITYSCDPGFQIKGDAERRCLSSGAWSAEEPKCISIRCLDPDDDDFKEKYPLVTSNLHVSVDPGHTADFECSDDPTKKVASAVCTNMGEWVPPPPRCGITTTSTTGAAEMTTPEAGYPPSDAAGTTPKAVPHPATAGDADTTTPKALPHPVTAVPTVEIGGATAPGGEVSQPPATDAPAPEDGLPTWIVALLVVIPVALVLGGVVAFLWKRSQRQHHRIPTKDEKNGAVDLPVLSQQV